MNTNSEMKRPILHHGRFGRRRLGPRLCTLFFVLITAAANALTVANEVNVQQVVKQRVLVDRLSNQYDQLEELKPEELREAMHILDIQDTVVEKTVAALQEALVEEAKMLATGIAEGHPRVKAVRAQIAAYREKLATMRDNILRAQKTKLEIEKATLEFDEERLKKKQPPR
jgi:hypothetical protein